MAIADLDGAAVAAENAELRATVERALVLIDADRVLSDGRLIPPTDAYRLHLVRAALDGGGEMGKGGG